MAGAFSLPEDVPVNQKDGMDMQFLEKTRQLEMYLEQKKYVEARLLLLQLQHLFPQLTFAERTSVEGIHAISETFIHLKHLLSAVQLNPNEIRHVARQFSLAVDALVFSDDTEQSRWKKQLKTLMDPGGFGSSRRNFSDKNNRGTTADVVQRIATRFDGADADSGRRTAGCDSSASQAAETGTQPF